VPAAPERDGRSDAALVAAARAGERVAFGALYERHARMVQAVLCARVAPDGVADLVHDVFLIAMGRLDSLRDDAAFAGWLATIARRRAADWRRRRRDSRVLGGSRAPPRRSRGRGSRVARERRAGPGGDRLAAEAYRETLLLRFVAGLTGPEIAQRTGLTHGSVRVNLHRGVALLRQRLEGGGERA
jgi:RNA polymerase sigma-70 factor (ECF subfamily)